MTPNVFAGKDDSRPLRILMMVHVPWRRELGGARVQLELGEELTKFGCQVSKYSYSDAFPDTSANRTGKLSTLMALLRSNQSFSARAVEWLRSNVTQFDVIDAHIADLPITKVQLGFSGLLVARSVGLGMKYDEFYRWAARRWRHEGTFRQGMEHLLTFPGTLGRRRKVLPSCQNADLINVSNQDDLITVRDELGFGSKVVMFPFGISESRRSAFEAAAKPAAVRQHAKVVAFVGTWNPRKGSKDLPEIFMRLKTLEPQARLLLLGTGIPEAHVRRLFPPQIQNDVTVVTSFLSEELPQLLANATVGAFPGYLEGFGISVLEKIAAGLPTVAYDATGPRDILQGLRPAMVPRGDTEAFAHALARLLKLPQAAYAEMARACRERARKFMWADIARETLQTYRFHLEKLSRA